MKINHYLYICLALLLFASCDPVFETQWDIDNQSNFTIEVLSKSNREQDQASNSLSPNTIQTIHMDDNIGNGNSFKEDESTILNHISFLEITNDNGDEVNIDVIQLESWNCEKQGSEFLKFTLVITDEDF